MSVFEVFLVQMNFIRDENGDSLYSVLMQEMWTRKIPNTDTYAVLSISFIAISPFALTTKYRSNYCIIFNCPFQKQTPKVFYKKRFLKNFAIFTGKHLCWSLFLIKLHSFSPSSYSEKEFSTHPIEP